MSVLVGIELSNTDLTHFITDLALEYHACNIILTFFSIGDYKMSFRYGILQTASLLNKDTHVTGKTILHISISIV